MIDVVESPNQGMYDTFQSVEVVFQDSKIRLSINSLLPDSWSIVQSPTARLHTDPDRKRVVIPTFFFNQPGNMFSILHELGHARKDSTRNEADIEEEILLRDKYSLQGPGSLSPTEKTRFRLLVIESEKSAWNWALRTIYDYRKRKIDLEPELSKAELEKQAKQKLNSYLR